MAPRDLSLLHQGKHIGKGTNEGSKREELLQAPSEGRSLWGSLQWVRVACTHGSAVGTGATSSYVPFGEAAVAEAWRQS